MTPTYTRIREAWNASDPTALHRAAEQLAGEGHAESMILQSLESLLLDVRAAGADDDTEEQIMGVMDRLAGWCHVSHHIRTKQPERPAADISITRG
jgi:hypothetical protein